MHRNRTAFSPRTPLLATLVLCVLTTSLTANIARATDAQASLLPQNPPRYRTGDSWTYQFTDALSPTAKTITQTVTSVRSDGSAIVQIGSGNGRVMLTPESNVIANASDQHSCGIGLHFPLREGAHYEADCQTHAPDGLMLQRRAQCEVKGVDTVTTKAGTFAAIKIRMTGSWTPQYGVGGGPMDETIWYAPAVKRVVRDEYQGRFGGKAAPTTTRMELVRYAVKP